MYCINLRRQKTAQHKKVRQAPLESKKKAEEEILQPFFISSIHIPHSTFLIPHSTLLENLQLRELPQQHLIHPLNPLAALLDVLTYIIYIIKEVAEGIQ